MREHHFELLVLDVMLPGINGFGILRQLRKSSDLPVIILTAHGSDNDRFRRPLWRALCCRAKFWSRERPDLRFIKAPGAEGLSRYFSKLPETSGTEAWLMDSSGRDVRGQAVPPSIKRFCNQTFETGVPAVTIRRLQFTAAVQLHGETGTFLAAFAFSFWLARKIAELVTQLRGSMRQYSGGSAEVPLPPGLLRRQDELGDLSRGFSQMQHRIEGLLQRQK